MLNNEDDTNIEMRNDILNIINKHIIKNKENNTNFPIEVTKMITSMGYCTAILIASSILTVVKENEKSEEIIDGILQMIKEFTKTLIIARKNENVERFNFN